jgi:hypothetical protein
MEINIKVIITEKKNWITPVVEKISKNNIAGGEDHGFLEGSYSGFNS